MVIAEIWSSFRRLPVWVQLWVAVILVPVNAASIFFLTAPGGTWVAMLAIGGMLPNLLIMLVERGLSRLMALPHILIWTPLAVFAGGLVADTILVDGSWRIYLIVLLAVDLTSLVFDIADFRRWWKGDRAIA